MFLLNKLFCLSNNSSQKDVTILDMPDLVMRKILKECDLYSILKLRKVCRGFRDFINYSTPEFTMKRLALFVYQNSFSIVIGTSKVDTKKARIGHSPNCRLKYFKHINGCVIQHRRTGKEWEKIWLKDVDYRTVFRNDLEAILQSYGSVLWSFRIVERKDTVLNEIEPDLNKWDNFKKRMNSCWKNEIENKVEKFEGFGFIQKALESRNRLLRAEIVVFNKTLSGNIIKELVPFIDSKVLKYNWKISEEELLELKEILFRSSNFKYFTLQMKFSIRIDLIKTFGPLSNSREFDWCYGIDGSDEVNRIHFDFKGTDKFQHQVQFSREKRAVYQNLQDYVIY